MAKSNSPIRLENTLMQKAKTASSLNKRSPAEQVEYWASLGQSVESLLDPEAVLRIKSGLARIRVETTESSAVDSDEVFSSLKEQQMKDELASKITTAPFSYRASAEHSGLLEKVYSDGRCALGQFENGTFNEVEK